MSKRKKISKEVELSILTKSRRRCSLCFGLSGNLKEKKGQIAHIDQDSSNSAEANLVFLCFDHHDQFDSSTSQSKGITSDEVKSYKEHLYNAVETGLFSHLSVKEIVEDNKTNHDLANFNQANEILSENQLYDFLDTIQTEDAYNRNGRIPVRDFRRYFIEVGNYYLLPQLEASVKKLLISLDKLLNYLSYNFFLYPESLVGNENPWFALYPDLNIDRAGSGLPEDMSRYLLFQKELNKICDEVRKYYKEYRFSIKQNLYC